MLENPLRAALAETAARRQSAGLAPGPVWSALRRLTVAELLRPGGGGAPPRAGGGGAGGVGAPGAPPVGRPAPGGGGWGLGLKCVGALGIILKPRPRWGAPPPPISITEEDHNIFQSTLPVRGATDLLVQTSKALSISIHAPREGSDALDAAADADADNISIHAPREGSDSRRPRLPPPLAVISIHAPREGSDMRGSRR